MYRLITALKLTAVIFTLSSLLAVLIAYHHYLHEGGLRSTNDIGNDINVRMLSGENYSTKLESSALNSSKTNVDGSRGPTIIEDTIIQHDFNGCRKPTYVPELKTSCWFECQALDWCANTTTYSDWKLMVDAKRAFQFCLPIHHVLGVQRSGTADVVKWFSLLPSYKITQKALPLMKKVKCPLAAMRNFTLAFPRDLKDNYWFNSDPDALFRYSVVSWNKRKANVISTVSMLGFLNEPRSRYVITLRNPSDMFLSYLHLAYRRGWIYTGVMPGQFTPAFKHVVVGEYIASVLECLAKRSEQICILGTEESKNSNLLIIIKRGFYSLYIEQLFRYIPREQVYFNMLEEYSTAQGNFSQKMLDLFGQKITWSPKAVEASTTRHNCDKAPPDSFLTLTIKSLDRLFEPYNQKLAELLGDRKWLFKRPGYQKMHAKCV